ncbi:lipopolysaccharide biosynthesis protein [Aerococcaceae bacterium WGS1372]
MIKSKLLENKKTIIYFSSTIISMILAFGTSSILTKLLDPDVFGLYRYATNFLLVIPTFFEFGLHFSVSRLVAEKNGDESDSTVFVGTLIVTILGLLLTLLLGILILFSNVFDINFGSLLDIKIVFPFMFVFMLRILVMQVYQGTGKTNMLAMINVFQYIVLLLVVLMGNYLSDLTFEFMIITFCLSWFIVMIPYFSSLKVNFSNFKEDIKSIFIETKNNGLYVYLGSIVTSSSSNVIALITGSLYGYVEYGYYSLALSFSQAFTVISSVMTVLNFKKNVNQKSISKSDLQIMIGLNILMYLLILIFIKPIFNLFFTPDYFPAIKYLLVLGIVYSLNGISAYFNRFFVARGLGKVTTRNSIIYAIMNIIATILLVPNFELMGIVYANLVANITGLLSYLIAYRQYLRE